MILGRRCRIELAMRALLESVLVMLGMTMLLLLFRSVFFVVWGRMRLCVFPLPLSSGARIVCVLGGVRVRGRGCAAVGVWICVDCLSGTTYGAVWGLGRALIERRRPPTLTAALCVVSAHVVRCPWYLQAGGCCTDNTSDMMLVKDQRRESGVFQSKARDCPRCNSEPRPCQSKGIGFRCKISIDISSTKNRNKKKGIRLIQSGCRFGICP